MSNATRIRMDMAEEVVINYEDPAKQGEHVLQITIDGVLIPYEEVMAEPINAQGKEEYKDW